MARFIGFTIFLLLLGGIFFIIIRGNVDITADRPVAERDDVDVISDQDRAVRKVEKSVSRASDLSDDLADLADDLDEAALEAEETAETSLQLSSSNDAAEASVAASYNAAERARDTAIVARRLSGELERVASDAKTAAEEAAEITTVAVDVERSQQKAAEAGEDAREADRKLEEAEEAVDSAAADANVYLARNARDAFYRPSAYAGGSGKMIVKDRGQTEYTYRLDANGRYVDSDGNVIFDPAERRRDGERG